MYYNLSMILPKLSQRVGQSATLLTAS